MRYEIVREGTDLPVEVTMTFDMALIKAQEHSKKESGSLRWFVFSKDRTERDLRVMFKRGARSDAKACTRCRRDGSWCQDCTGLGWIEVRA